MRVITVGSGKGGTGKSFVAANVGLALAQRGIKTCVVDFDLGSADVHLILGHLQPVSGVLDVLRGHASSLADVMHAAPHCPNLFIVPGAGETVRAAGLSTREIEKLTGNVRELPVEVAIVDLPGGVQHQVLDMFLAGDTQLLVTTPDPVAVTDAARFLRLARVRRAARGANGAASDRRPRVYTSLDDLVRDMNAIRGGSSTAGPAAGFNPALILNRCRPDALLGKSDLLAQLRREAGDTELPLRAEIPEDAAVDRSVRLLAPVIDLSPAAPASRTIFDLASWLAPAGPTEGWASTKESETALA